MSFSKPPPPDPNDYDPYNALPARKPLSRRAALPHAPPAKEYVVLKRYTIEEFFRERPPFSRDTIMKYVHMEDGWSPEHVPRDVLARGGLRIAIWMQIRPTPNQHFEEFMKRLPCTEAARGAKLMFLESARLQHEAKRDVTTKRCPICASQLLGYAYADHDRKKCPFRGLTPMKKMEFMANNLIAFCNICNSRSTSHAQSNCDETLRCQNCKHGGHTMIQNLCFDPLGFPDPKSQANQKQFVAKFREDYVKRVQTLIADPRTTIGYVIRSDYDLTLDMETRPPIDAQGWGFRHSVYAPKPSPLQCSNFRKGKVTEYNTMVSPEYRADIQQKVPQFDPLAYRYLNQVGDIVTRIRNGENIPDSQWPVYNPENELAGEPTKDSGEVDDDVGFVEFAPSPPPSARPPPPPPKPPARITTTFDRTETNWFREHAPHAQHRVTPPPVVEYDEVYLEQAVARARAAEQARATVSTPNFSTLAQESEPRIRSARNTSRPRRSQASRSFNPHGEGTSAMAYQEDEYESEPEPNKSFDRNTKEFQAIEIEAEIKLSRSARQHCREVSIIDNAPARPSFEKKPFNILAHEMPETRQALLVRVSALQDILTGMSDERYGIYAKYTTEQIADYATALSGYGHILYHEPFLYSQLHSVSARTVQMKNREGSDVLFIPTIDLWKRESVKLAVNQLIETRPDQPSLLENFSTLQRYWYSAQLVIGPARLPEHNQLIGEGTLDAQFHWNHNPTRRVYEYPPNMLEAYLELKVPTQAPALFKRIAWTIRMLTLAEFHENRHQDLDRYPLFDYLQLLRAATGVLLDLREESTAIHVYITDCPVLLATEASRAHMMALPSLVLFEKHSAERWRAWTNLYWIQLKNEVMSDWNTHACPCHEPENW